MNVRIREWNLKDKIILHVVVIGALTALVLSYVFINTQRAVVRTMSQQKLELISPLIEKSLYLFMKEGRITNLESTLGEIAASHDIQKIRIINRQGRILHSSEIKEVGGSEDSRHVRRWNDFLLQRERSRIFFVKSPTMIQGLSLIENKGACLGCHSDQTAVSGILEVAVDYSATAALLKRSQLKAILLAFFSLAIVTFVILRLFEKLINRPISQLKNKMKKVEEGDLAIPFSSSGNDEIGGLSRSFEIMVQKLKDSNRQIHELFDKQMEKAEHLASIGELAAGLAHEIRNPIAGIMGALEIITAKTEASDPRKEIFSEMHLQIVKINNIIQDLLSYAKPREISVSLVNPDECVRNAIRLAEPQVKKKEILFRFKGLGNGHLARLDADKIQEVLLNLMLNSIAAIPERGGIFVELLKKDERDLRIVFTDDGTGIREDVLPHIFTPFFTTKSGGTGLGLSICKKIIEAHAGSIQVKSAVGHGTTFLIDLPVLQSGG